MVFLTATPHSGNDEAFHNLLGLLHPDFRELGSTEGSSRQNLRERLAAHFVQRQRADIREWREEGTVFPDRETAEATYTLSGAWGRLFDEVLEYARGMVRRAEGKDLLVQRMNWWAALALLRCVSSSPASAAVALNTRLHAVEGLTEPEQVNQVDQQGAESVFDGEAADSLGDDDAPPPGTVDDPAEAGAEALALRGLIGRAEELRGPANDPKLKKLIEHARLLIQVGFRPVIFCIPRLCGNPEKPLANRG
jgi:hypothetical protein